MQCVSAAALAAALGCGCVARPGPPQGAHLSLRFRLGRAMPVRGEQVTLTAWVYAAPRLGRRALVHFVAGRPSG
ncbi:MAG: hypothetical protein ACODAJ_01395, partial [Planctomycetota bacterium]